MKYPIVDIENVETELRRVAVRPKSDQINELGSVEITSTGIPSPTNPVTWNAIASYTRYRVIIKRPSTDATLVNRTVEGTSFAPDFTAQAGDTVQVFTSRRVPTSIAEPTITGVAISSGTQVEENSTLTLTGSVQGTGSYNTAGTWTRTSGSMTFTTNGNEITISAGALNDASTFRFTAADGTFAERTVTTVASSNYVPVDSLQGDFDALQALYNATQGQDVPTLASVNDLPTNNLDASYPYMYMINGEIHYMQHQFNQQFTGNHSTVWINAGAPWPDKTGWDTMTPETMGDALGVTTDANGRVVELDLWRINLRPNGASNPGYYGNNLCGELPPEINNLRLQYCALKQNFLFGSIPDISNWSGCSEISLAGQDQYLQHLEYSDRGQWHETNHWSGSPKTIVTTNRFKTNIPDISGFQNITLFELRHQFLTGDFPAWDNMPSIMATFLDSPKDAGPNSIAGSTLPLSLGNLTTHVFFAIGGMGLTGEFPSTINDNWTEFAKISLDGNPFYGPMPQFIKSRDKRYYSVGNTNFGLDESGNLLPPEQRGFPTGIFNGDNAFMTKFQISNIRVAGVIPERPEVGTPNDPSDPNNDRYELRAPTYPNPRTNYGIDAPGFGGNPDLGGPIPEWFQTMLGIQTWYISGNSHTEWPELIQEQNNLKTFYVDNNDITQPIPDKGWAQRRIPWFLFQENSIPGSIPDKWISLFVQSTDSMGWATDQTFSGTGTTLTWSPVTGAIAYEVEIRNSSGTLARRERWMTTESLTVTGLDSDTYTWRVRGLIWRTGWSRFTAQGNNLSGYLHDWYGHVGGFEYSLNFDRNRYTFADVADNYAFLKQQLGNNFTIRNQKPFDEPETVQVASGGSFTIDKSAQATAGNTYQWTLNGVAISGETNHTITVNNPNNLDMYRLEITNNNYPDLKNSAYATNTIVSEPITVSII